MSDTKKRWLQGIGQGLIYVLVLWVVFALVNCTTNSARGDTIKPLTRDEPIVRMVLQEAANEPFPGQIAVAGVALDRVRDARWPDSAGAVVYQPFQFTAMADRLRSYSHRQIDRARAAVEVARTGTRPCGTVLWYHTLSVAPSWRLRFEEKCRIGLHIFYGDEE